MNIKDISSDYHQAWHDAEVEASNQFVNAAHKDWLDGKQTDDVCEHEVGDLCALLHTAFMQGALWQRKHNASLNEYQHNALLTAVYPEDKRIIYPSLGMCGEAGEVADKVKKVIRDNNQSFDDERKEAIALEIGDVLWYCATLAHDLGYTLEDVARMNIDKLASRQQRGKLGGSGDNR